MAVLAAGASELEGQLRQALATAAPVLLEYVPAPHAVQPSEPTTALYVPAGQPEQAPPLGPVQQCRMSHVVRCSSRRRACLRTHVCGVLGGWMAPV